MYDILEPYLGILEGVLNHDLSLMILSLMIYHMPSVGWSSKYLLLNEGLEPENHQELKRKMHLPPIHLTFSSASDWLVCVKRLGKKQHAPNSPRGLQQLLLSFSREKDEIEKRARSKSPDESKHRRKGLILYFGFSCDEIPCSGVPHPLEWYTLW